MYGRNVLSLTKHGAVDRVVELLAERYELGLLIKHCNGSNKNLKPKVSDQEVSVKSMIVSLRALKKKTNC